MRVYLAAAASLAVACAAASAAAQSVKMVHVMGDDIAVPMPAGFCEPTGKYQANAQRAAASDTQNVTFLTLFRCDEMAAGADLHHLIYIKGPKTALSVKATRPELLKALGDIPPSALADAISNEKVSPGVEQDAGKVFGREVKIDTQIKPAAADAYGWYMAGTVDFSVGEQRLGLAVALGMTAVKGHVLSYNLYAPGMDVAAIRAALAETQAATRRFVEAN